MSGLDQSSMFKAGPERVSSCMNLWAYQLPLLGEVLQPMAFEMLVHFGCGLGYYTKRCRTLCTLVTAEFGSCSSPVQRTVDL